jgi:hypothetical protein
MKIRNLCNKDLGEPLRDARALRGLVACIAAFGSSGSKYQVLDTNILNTRGTKCRYAAAKPTQSERDSSGTTEPRSGEGDGADSPTRAQAKPARSGSPKLLRIAYGESDILKCLCIAVG